MSLKQEIETWVSALAAYDNNEFDSALQCFQQIADTSKILFNIGIIHATLGEHAAAVACYQQAVQLDQYLAVAYFQQGVSNFLMGDFEEALANFNDALLYLRGNRDIDYEQLGLKFKLYSCEALFNRGLCYIYLQQKDAGLQDMIYAAKEKVVPDHDVIDEAIKEQAEGYTVFSIPVGIVYRPNAAKVKNLKHKDYLGKARLVAQQEQVHGDPRRALAAIGVDDRPTDRLSYAALNLVRPALSSRPRQQSEPPIQRNLFPPTPPPENDRTGYTPQLNSRGSVSSFQSQGSGVQSNRPAAKSLRLDLGVAAFEKQPRPEDKPRLGTRRTESERPTVRREFSASSRNSGGRKRQHSTDQPDIYVQEDPVQAYTSPPASAPGFSQRRSDLRHTQHSIAEEEEEVNENDMLTPKNPLAFEIIPPKPLVTRQRSMKRTEVRKIRIKVHAEDTRYVMVTPEVSLLDLMDMIRAKFQLSGSFKLKIKDEENDLVTMSDQDDLDMAMAACKATAQESQADMGKLEVWLQ